MPQSTQRTPAVTTELVYKNARLFKGFTLLTNYIDGTLTITPDGATFISTHGETVFTMKQSEIKKITTGLNQITIYPTTQKRITISIDKNDTNRTAWNTAFTPDIYTVNGGYSPRKKMTEGNHALSSMGYKTNKPLTQQTIWITVIGVVAVTLAIPVLFYLIFIHN